MVQGIYFDQETRSFSAKAEAKLEAKYHKLIKSGKSHDEAIKSLHRRNNLKTGLRTGAGSLLMADAARAAYHQVKLGKDGNKLIYKALRNSGISPTVSKTMVKANKPLTAGQIGLGATVAGVGLVNHKKTKAAINKLDEKYKK